jgi:hypothetical protein
LFLELSGVVAELDGFGRFGRTAEADIPDSLKMAAKVLSKDSR